MLKEIIEKGHYKFVDSVDDWKDSIRKSCEVLIKDNTVDERYPEGIIETVEKYGPYIVLVPNVAMPHSQENAEGVNKTAVSFMRVSEAVVFDPEDREKDARIFFTLASEDPEKHLENISQLSEILCNEEIVDALIGCENLEDLKKVQEKYNI
jgi:PTS system ascorbate-specific IIA component